MFCGNCGKTLPDGATFCPDCGWQVPATVGMAAGSPSGEAAPEPVVGAEAGGASFDAAPQGAAPGAAPNAAPANAAPASGENPFCPVCGTRLTSANKFCPVCGWRVGSRVKKGAATRATESIAQGVNKLTGNNDRVELAFKDFFDAVPRHHSHVEAERLLTCGTPETTPPITEVSEDWPHPWVYSRVFVVLLITLLLDVALTLEFGNVIGIPTIMFLGSALMPVVALIFFFEANVPRNISFATTLEILLVGGIASLVSIYFNPLLDYSGTGDVVSSLLTGVVEELAKAAITIFFLWRLKDKHYILNGLLIGAAVGAGFALFESAGYAFYAYMRDFWSVAVNAEGIQSYAQQLHQTYPEWSFDYIYATILYKIEMLAAPGAIRNVIARAIGAIGGHVAWAAAEGGAFALCYRDGGFSIRHIADKRFLAILAICIVLHGTWDTFAPEFFNDLLYDALNNVMNATAADYLAVFLAYFPLIAGIWIVLDVLLQRGLVQVDQLNDVAPQAQSPQPQDAGQAAPPQA